MNSFQSNIEIENLIKKYPFLLEILGDWDQKTSYVNVLINKLTPNDLFFKGRSAVVELVPDEGSNAQNLSGTFLIADTTRIYSKDSEILREINWENYDRLLKDSISEINSTSIEYVVNIVRGVSLDTENDTTTTFVDIYTLPIGGIDKVFNDIDMLSNIVLNYNDFISGMFTSDKYFFSLVPVFEKYISYFTENIYTKILKSVILGKDTSENNVYTCSLTNSSMFIYVLDEKLTVRLTNSNTKIVLSKSLINDGSTFGIEKLAGKHPDLIQLLNNTFNELNSYGDQLSDKITHLNKVITVVVL